MELTEKRLSGELIYDGKIVHLYKDKIELPDGKTSYREYIKHLGAACVVPVTDEGEVILTMQYRYPFSAVLTEIPAGKLDSASEDPLEAAKRELKEETGAEAEEIIYLGEFYPTCAYTDEIIHMYLAKGLSFGDRKLDDGEFIDVIKMPLDNFVKDIMDGKIKDGKTQTAVLKAYYYIKNNP